MYKRQVLSCTIIFYLLAQILTPSSTYNPNNDLQRAKCSNKLEKRVYDALRFKGYYPIVQYKVPNKPVSYTHLTLPT
ncbi:hypothetical protein JDS91_36660, partial [Bacillus cereus]|nr:hypothetical protein [Bacillus cereus]